MINFSRRYYIDNKVLVLASLCKELCLATYDANTLEEKTTDSCLFSRLAMTLGFSFASREGKRMNLRLIPVLRSTSVFVHLKSKQVIFLLIAFQ